MKFTVTFETDEFPEGWEPIAFRKVLKGDWYYNDHTGEILEAEGNMGGYKYVVVRKKRWVAEPGEDFYRVHFDHDGLPYAKAHVETTDTTDYAVSHAIGNYFRTKEDAEVVTKRITQILLDAHK